MAALLGLTAALCYGIGDYLARVAGRQVGVWPVLFFTELVSLVLLSLWIGAATSPAPLFFNAPPDIRMAALLSALLLFVAVTLLTVGLVRGNLAVVAPVTATYGAVTTALAVLGGEPLSVTVATGLLLTIGGVCLLSVPANAGSPVRTHLQASGFGWAIGAALCYGIGLWMQGQFAVPAMGPLLPVWLCFAVGTGVLLLFAVLSRRSLVPPRGGALLTIVMSGLFGVLAYVALAAGLATGMIAIVVVLSTLASAVTVFMSSIFERAPIARHQWLALALIVAGLSLVRI